MPVSNVIPFPSSNAARSASAAASAVQQANAERLAADAAARAQALNPQASFLVEAPAGSGKTSLLVERFLKLLLDENLTAPEQVLAITFTRKATAELRERVLRQLDEASAGKPLDETAKPIDHRLRALADAVLERDRAAQWNLREGPQRLNVRSIDSVCSAITQGLPVLTGSGGMELHTEAEPLYRAAARRTTFELGGSDRKLDEALRTVFLHRDGSLADVERLLAEMLKTREQWGEFLPLGNEEMSDEDLDERVRPRLERALEDAVCAGLSRAAALMPQDLLERLAELASSWAGLPGYKGSRSPLAVCANRPQAPQATADALEHWKALLHLLLKKDREWRKSPQAFYVNTLQFEIPKTDVPQLKDIVAQLENDRLREALKALDSLPPARYPEEQWQVTKALFRVLRHALAELKILFAERGVCDFAELSITARAALRQDPVAAAAALVGDGGLRHLLVDEMQDTSAAQYDLLELLTKSWDGHTQTLFLVGDPKQSIYAFRQAQVSRFLRVAHEQKLGDVPLTALRLTANFRSHPSLVECFNDTFDRLFPAPEDDALRLPNGDVPFVEAVAGREDETREKSEPVLHWHTEILRSASSDGEKKNSADADESIAQASADSAQWLALAAAAQDGVPPVSPARQCAMEQAREIRVLIQRLQAKPFPAERVQPGKANRWSIAVLASARSHLRDVAAELREAGIAYRAVDIDSLAERQEVLDCLALTRALLHPGDRIAWLAVLRAPWCGLGLADLLALTGEGESADRAATVHELVERRGEVLSAEGRRLLARAWPTLRLAVEMPPSGPWSAHIERTWLSLGGDAALQPQERTNVRRFWALLREAEAVDRGRIEMEQLAARVGELYAEPTGSSDDVQLLTIHKAKGLEWDVVFIPGLERKPRGNRSELLQFLELDSADADASRVLPAPIAGKGEESGELQRWMRNISTAREKTERMRVFYVACTRAREELHLFAALGTKKDGKFRERASGSLLEACWLAAKESFERKASGVDDRRSVDEASLTLRTKLAASVRAIDEETRLEDRAGGFALAASVEEQSSPDVVRVRLEASLQEGATGGALLRNAPMIERLPLEFEPRARFMRAAERRLPYATVASASPLFERPEGSFGTRAFGNVVHRFLEYLATRLALEPAAALLKEVDSWTPRLTAGLRGEGLSAAASERESERVLGFLRNTLSSETGRWILSAHPYAASETAFASSAGTVRADRVFFGGAQPGSMGDSDLWIVDFKTTEQGSRSDALFEQQERKKYTAQMETYATLLRHIIGGQAPIRLGLFYPSSQRFLAWTSASFIAGNDETTSSRPAVSGFHPVESR